MDHEAVVERGGLKRRQVVKGAAWAVPTVTIAATAPALAASTTDPVQPTVNNGASCKHSNESPDEQRYHIVLDWTNTFDCASTVTVTGITVLPNSGSPVDMMGLPGTTVIGAGDTVSIVYDSFPTADMANGTATITYSYTNCAGETVNTSANVVVSSLPPCQANGIQWPHE